jgi:nucleoside phosphorylase
VPGRILVVSAFEPELAPLRLMLGRAARVRLQPVGIGAVDAAVGAARALAAHRPDRVVFVGTAGVYAGARALPIGGAAVAGEVHLVSTAALSGRGYLPRPMALRAPPPPRLGRELAGAAEPLVAVACPLAITRSPALARRIAGATGASLENLELFAVARAAAAAGIELAAVLGIANRVGPAAHGEWLAHHRAASEAACTWVAAWILSPSGSRPRPARHRKLP